MDAKMRADFINSVASGQKIPCPSCNTLNKPDSNFCMTCGCRLKSQEDVNNSNDVQTFSSVENKEECVAEKPVTLNSSEKPSGENPPEKSANAFSPIKPTSENSTAKLEGKSKVNTPKKKREYSFKGMEIEDSNDEASVFAQGLPTWDIVPPQIVVRRKAKR